MSSHVIDESAESIEFFFDVRFSKFVFTYVHLCEKPNIQMDKLAHYGLG